MVRSQGSPLNLTCTQVGCFGLLLGSLLGLLLAVILLILLAGQAASPILAQPVTPPADVTLFFSEQVVSRLVSEAAQEPAAIDFEPGGQVVVTMPVDLGGVKPVVQLGLTLESQGNQLVSWLHWLKLGFLKIPAGWLPQELVEVGHIPGEAITQQLPPEFSLVGLTTTTDGLTFHLNSADWP